MTDQTAAEPLVVDPAAESGEALGLTPPEQIVVMTVQVNALGSSTWQYSIPHADASQILREIADQIDIRTAEQAAEEQPE